MKAFDKVSHKNHLIKLQASLGNTPLFQWIEAFLIYRRQFVNVRDKATSLSLVDCGVPQGSVLGHPLFLVFLIK